VFNYITEVVSRRNRRWRLYPWKTTIPPPTLTKPLLNHQKRTMTLTRIQETMIAAGRQITYREGSQGLVLKQNSVKIGVATQMTVTVKTTVNPIHPCPVAQPPLHSIKCHEQCAQFLPASGCSTRSSAKALQHLKMLSTLPNTPTSTATVCWEPYLEEWATLSNSRGP